ncbi:IclR family transcriptional regulator C-terminal domain-containing protein [Streptomyces sp. NBC_00268]|nr:IclR family transcriptional regulator C-terminal domain-containing protein [Streptomyces sp. NBC_00268]
MIKPPSSLVRPIGCPSHCGCGRALDAGRQGRRGGGRWCCASAGPELVEQVIEQGLTAYTERTVTDPARLLEQLDECRQTGVAVVRQETTPGADSVATRVLDDEGNTVAALSVVVSAGSVDLRTIRPAVIASGLAVSRRLGWNPSVGVKQAQS